MALVLDTLMQENSDAIKKYRNEVGNILLCHCYPKGDPFEAGERLIQVRFSIDYKEL